MAKVGIRILKTYKDAKSYYREGDLIVFNRPLGIKRNAVVLPKGYALVSVNIPVQVIEETDGRIGVSFMNPYPGEAPLIVKARPVTVAAAATTTMGTAASSAPADPAPRERPMNEIRIGERAFQDREIVYFLKDPETHAFSLYHDYTETREGVDKYVNVVRTGSSVSEPSAKILDTGEALKTEVPHRAGARQARTCTSTSRSMPTRRSSSFRFQRSRRGSRSACGSPKPTPTPRATR